MNNRIASLDAFRGLMLLSMTFNHLCVLPFVCSLESWAKKYVYNSFGYLSNSEGFFFLAGLVAGIVYGKLAISGRHAEMWLRIKKRIFHMYLIHVTLLFTFAILLTISRTYLFNWEELHALVWVWKNQPGVHYFLDHPWKGSCMGSLFLYHPSFFDILPVYMLFLAIIPPILRKLNEGKVKLVLGISISLWLISQYFPTGILEKAIQTYLPVKLGWFHPLALQVLFVIGLTLGYFYKKGTLINKYRLFLYVVMVLAVLFSVLWLTGADMTNVHHLGFCRLSMFALKACIACVIARIFTFKPLALLGRYALAVFTYHIVLVYGLIFFLSEISNLSVSHRVICLLLSIASLWLPVIYLEKRKAIQLSEQKLKQVS